MQEESTIAAAMHLKISGEYMAEVRHADGTVTEIPWFKNLILNSGLDDMGLGVSGRTNCHVGTGTSTPAVTQVALDARLGGMSGGASTQVNLGSPTYKSETTHTYTFTQGAIVGNITEVGVGNTSTGTRLFSRSLFTDGVGTPIAITITSADQLVVYHKVTVTPPLTDGTGSVTISGLPYSYTTRLLNAGGVIEPANFNYVTTLVANSQTQVYDSSAALALVSSGAMLGVAIGTSTSVTQSVYTLGSFVRNNTVVWGPTVGNSVGGIRGVQLSTSSGVTRFQILLGTAIPKTNVQQLTMTFQLSWGR